MSNLYFDLSCYFDLVIWKTILSRGLKKWRWILVWGEIACGVVVSCGRDRRLLYCLCHKRAFLDRKENNVLLNSPQSDVAMAKGGCFLIRPKRS